MRPFADFVTLCESLQKLDTEKAKMTLIAAELEKCTPAERKIWLKLLLVGELPPPSGRPRMEKIVAAVCGVPEADLKAKVEKAGHGSLVVEDVWPKHAPSGSPLTIDDVMALFEQGGVEANLGRMSGREVAWLWRLLDRRLTIRLGVRPVLNAVHPDAHKAYKHTGSLDELLDRFVPSAPAADPAKAPATPSPDAVESLSSASSASAISLFTPIKPMLASPCHSIPELGEQLARLLRRSSGAGSVPASAAPIRLQVEDKYDGERVQIHHAKGERAAVSFSRNLKPTVPWKLDALRDALPAAFGDASSLIIDGEMLVVDTATGQPLPFGTLAVHKFAALPATASVCVVVFDLLYLNGASLLSRPLSERRALLEKLLKPVPHRVELAPARIATAWGAVEGELESAIERGIEGLIVKEASLAYRPDARHWWKLKRDYLEGMADTVDLLLLGAYQGSGMRGGQLASFLMGCLARPAKNDSEALAPGAWRTVCRVGSGLSAAQLAALQEPLRQLMRPASAGAPSWLSVTPLHAAPFYVADPLKAPVWEIAGTSVLASPQHTSGHSVRFPRFIRERPDKDWATHTALEQLRTLVAPPRRAYSTRPRRQCAGRPAACAPKCRVRARVV